MIGKQILEAIVMTDEEILEWFILYGDKPTLTSNDNFVFKSKVSLFASTGCIRGYFDHTGAWRGYKLTEEAIRRIQNEK